MRHLKIWLPTALAVAVISLVGAWAQGPTRERLSAPASSGGSTAGDGGYVYSGCAGAGLSGALCQSGASGSATPLTVDAGIIDMAPSGANAFAVGVNGARVDFGAGASDYCSSNGTTVTFAGPLATASTMTVTGKTIYGDTASTHLDLDSAVGSQLIYGNTSVLVDSEKMVITSDVADSSIARALRIRTNNALATPGAYLTQWINSSQKASMDFSGFISSATPHPVGLESSTGKRLGEYVTLITTATTHTAVGLPDPSLEAAESVFAAPAPTGGTRMYVKHQSAAVITDGAGISGPYTSTRALYRPRLSGYIVTDPTDIALQRLWFAVTDSDLSAVVVPTTAVASAVNFAGLAYDTAVSANWACCGGDGTNKSCDDTGVAVAVSTEYRLVADWTTAGTLRCCVNGTCVNKTTNLSVAAVNMGIQASVTSIQALTAKNINLSTIALEQN